MIKPDSLLEVDRLSKRFRSKWAVDELTFALSPGSIMGLLGGNGAGKTTTLSMLLGLLEPTSGSIRLFGHDFVKNRHAVLHRMNFCSPYVDLPQRLTVRENLRFFARLYGVHNSSARIEELTADFRLLELMDQPIRQDSADDQCDTNL